jgi:hypothetical protein
MGSCTSVPEGHYPLPPLPDTSFSFTSYSRGEGQHAGSRADHQQQHETRHAVVPRQSTVTRAVDALQGDTTFVTPHLMSLEHRCSVGNFDAPPVVAPSSIATLGNKCAAAPGDRTRRGGCPPDRGSQDASGVTYSLHCDGVDGDTESSLATDSELRAPPVVVHATQPTD